MRSIAVVIKRQIISQNSIVLDIHGQEQYCELRLLLLNFICSINMFPLPLIMCKINTHV